MLQIIQPERQPLGLLGYDVYFRIYLPEFSQQRVPESLEQMRHQVFVVEVVHHVVEAEAIHAIIKPTIAIGVHPKLKQTVVIIEHLGTVQVNGSYLAENAVIT